MSLPFRAGFSLFAQSQKRIFVIAAAWVAVAVFPATGLGEVVIDLEKTTHQQVPIAVQTFFVQPGGGENPQLGLLSRDILENDLRLSEFFTLIDRRKFADLELRENSKDSLNYDSWNAIKTRWLVKAQYSHDAKNNSVVFVFRLYDVVSKKFLLGKQYRGPLGTERRIAHRFADEVMALLGNGVRGVAETRMAFIAQDGEKKEVFLIDIDGTNLERLTVDNSIAVAPSWSPGGASLLYTSYADHNPDLIMIDANGKNRRAFLTIPGINTSAAWSPDGERVAVTLSRDKNAEVYVYDKKTGLNRLTHHFNIDTSPTWSPDGKRIAFTSDRSGTAEPQIYIMDAQSGDESALKRITFDSSYNDDPAWSPDGDHIAFTTRVGRGFRIKVHDMATGKAALLNSAPGSQERPTWSPDGRFVAYMQKENGKPQIFIQRLGGGKPRRLTYMNGGAQSPSWSPFPRDKSHLAAQQVAETPAGP